ncbi:MAG: DUF4097 family beta strand repeat-containing protein [Bacteroidetes bacterium]|nr:DUF4097 family beta strand repeat-containing protein [Bacteroidota bacterium]MCY4204561.1 DUF4097 family beta strand repeat-containing protein [Bacteroidota bacterium]
MITLVAPVLAQITLTPIDEDFAVKDVLDLVVNVNDADVTVNTSDMETLNVQVIVKGNNRSKSMEYYEKQNFNVKLDKSTLRVFSERDSPYRESYDWRNPVDIHVNISMPSKIFSDIRTSDGDLVIDELNAGAVIKTSDGNISIGRASGDEVAIQTSDGDIDAEWMEGESISVRTSDGDIKLGVLNGDLMRIQTSDGDIQIDSAAGELVARTSDGDVYIGRVSGAKIAIQTSDGDIDAARLEGESITLRTSDGDVVAETLTGGSLKVQTSDGNLLMDEISSSNAAIQASDGEIDIAKVSGSLIIRTGDGDVRIGLIDPTKIDATISGGNARILMPEDLPVTLDVKARNVKMDSFPNFSGNIEKSSIDGSLNGGGALIRVRTFDGDAVMRRNEH